MPAGQEDAARSYYGDLLGFPEISKPSSLRSRGGVWFQSHNLQIHLGVEEHFQPAKKAHIGYLVGNLDVVRQRLMVAGYPIVDDEALPGFTRFYTEDPFGNRVEMLTPTA